MEHPWAEANRLAMHQPAGMRPKVCKDSPSLKEDELYSAILKAIRSLVQGTRKKWHHPAGSSYTLHLW